MNKEKWLKIYNSIIRLQFYGYILTEDKVVKNEIDSKYQQFVSKILYIDTQNEKVEFLGGDFSLCFAYLILVRINEFISSELDNESKKYIKLVP